jgi:hypothetical protein
MVKTTTLQRPAARSVFQSAPPAQADRLLAFREVHALTGSNCKTGAYARQLAARGLIRQVRLNERTLRYSEASVLALIRGDVAA